MSVEFAAILRGLAANRRLSPRAISRACARAESTINQLLNCRIPPTVELLHDLASVLQLPVADLLVIAGLPAGPVPDRPAPYPVTAQIGGLVAAASWLTPDQVQQLTTRARQLRAPDA